MQLALHLPGGPPRPPSTALRRAARAAVPTALVARALAGSGDAAGRQLTGPERSRKLRDLLAGGDALVVRFF
jgi:hypothetical protein